MSAESDSLAATMAKDVLDGLRADPKTISSRWLYDARGSQLFEDITALPEYYPTRTETAIFETHAGAMAQALGARAVLVEYGAGALVKTRIILDALTAPAAYVPIDISGAFLKDAADDLARDYPGLTVVPIVADFTKPVDLSTVPGASDQRVGFFPGSTLGNLTNKQIVAFLTAARAGLGRGSRFLLGVDLKKDPSILIPAYDDAAGVTAAFNLNLLARLNRELGADFDPCDFRHEAVWNEAESRIEMHLVATAPVTATLVGETIDIAKGEHIRTEISRKFDLAAIAALAGEAGWRIETTWQDERGWFAEILLVQKG